MPYYIYMLTVKDPAARKSATLLNEFEQYREARTEVKQLRTGKPPGEGQSYKIVFAETEEEAEKIITENREETIVREWEK